MTEMERDREGLEKLEILQRIAFESGRQSAMAGNRLHWSGGELGKRGELRGALLLLQLLDDMEEWSSEEVLMVAAYSNGIDYGQQQHEQEFEEKEEG